MSRFVRSHSHKPRVGTRTRWQLRSRKKAEFLAALDGLSAAGGSDLVKNASAVGLHRVLGNEKLSGDFAIAKALGDQRQNLELPRRDAERLLAGRVGSEEFAGASYLETSPLGQALPAPRSFREPSRELFRGAE